MAEALISPGVFLRENDLTQISQGPITVGAALMGPTVLGPINIPTVVRSYSDFKSRFGAMFITGCLNYEYLTSIAAYNYFQQGGDSLLVTRVVSGTYTAATASVVGYDGTASFSLETISEGEIMNNDFSASTAPQGALPSGSANNVRWEVTFSDTKSGQFTLLVRRGDDYDNQKTVLETWSNLSLDPNTANYIGYVIGDQKIVATLDENSNYYLNYSGSYQNKSRYIRVKSVDRPLPGYIDNQGRANTAYTSSLPATGSGTYNGAFGTAVGAITTGSLNLFVDIPSSTTGNIQGVSGSDYDVAISLLKSKDQFDFKTITAPGLNMQNADVQINSLLRLAEERGTCVAVVDPVAYGQGLTTVTNTAALFDSSYGASYWPWVQLRSQETGKLLYCPASTVIPGVYEYNDKVAAEWFAPAGLTRGGLSTVVQPERRLIASERDTLYANKVNPVAIFPGQGTAVYGQKTLQSKASALDRVNVRRLLIALKRYIGQIAETLVFEQNSMATRNSFLSRVNPYLQYVQQQQGLYAFRVVMDETNNSAEVIDRNQLVGAIYLQPTKTAEFVLLDFNILPTGATFGA